MNREDAAALLMRHYRDDPYQCKRADKASAPLVATAHMHLVSERKLLSVAAAGYTQSDDLVYIYSMARLDAALAEDCRRTATEDALRRIVFDPDHSFSLISLFFLCDKLDASARAYVKKTKYRRRDSAPSRGWVELRMAAFTPDFSATAANPMGRTLLRISRGALRDATDV